MKIRFWSCVVLLALFAFSACSGDDDDGASDAPSQQTSSDSDGEQGSATDEDQTSPADGGEESSPLDDGEPSPVDGNASVTLGENTYRFATGVCDLSGAADGEEVTGLITVDGMPTVVEIFVSTSGTGSVSLNVGLDADTPIDETLEETLARGLTQIWQFFFEADALSELTDTRVRGAGTFTLVLATGGNGSSGDTLEGSFTADCG